MVSVPFSMLLGSLSRRAISHAPIGMLPFCSSCCGGRPCGLNTVTVADSTPSTFSMAA
jgi:hypothetical protein